MPWHILTIARNTFVESIRQPIYFILIALCGIAVVFTTASAAFSMGYSDTSEVSGDNKVLLDIGLATVFVLGMVLASFLATAVIGKEIEQKTVLTVVSKPVSRVSLVLGKYLGVAGAIVIACSTMLLFMQMGLRHQVMSTASDSLDGPVLVFGGLAIGISLFVGIWGNFFYGWVFTQTTTMLLFPLMFLAWIGVMLVGKEWHIQPPWADFKPQIAMASIAILVAHLVLTAVATAASARLGQVMTIVIMIAVFMGGLLNNYFIGRHALVPNPPFSQVQSAKPESASMEGMTAPGDRYVLSLAFEPRYRVEPGTVVFYGPNPSSAGLVGEGYPPGRVDAASPEALADRTRQASLVLISSAGREAVVQRIGAQDGADKWVRRVPEKFDFLFVNPTTYKPLVLGLWGSITNVQFFWLIDAVSQNQPIPFSHLGLIILYGMVQIGFFLSLAVALFQTREVG